MFGSSFDRQEVYVQSMCPTNGFFVAPRGDDRSPQPCKPCSSPMHRNYRRLVAGEVAYDGSALLSFRVAQFALRSSDRTPRALFNPREAEDLSVRSRGPSPLEARPPMSSRDLVGDRSMAGARRCRRRASAHRLEACGHRVRPPAQNDRRGRQGQSIQRPDRRRRAACLGLEGGDSRARR